MYRKFMEILKIITEDLLDKGKDFDEAILKFDKADINLFRVNDELKALERSQLIDDDEADAIRSVLVYLFMKDTTIETEDIYILVYGEKVTWH